MLNQAKTILKQRYGYENFRKGQTEIIDLVLHGKDALGIMPTGGGKSITYQIPALLFPGLTLVISPLISLMKDQVDALKSIGISATFINSSLSQEEITERMNRVQNGEFKLLYMAPERLDTPFFMSFVKTQQISFVAIDEAHCISEWGHDFRPSYLQIASFIRSIPQRPILLALTATASPRVKDDICHHLGIPLEHVVQTGFARENLRFHVVKGQNRDAFLLDYIAKNKDEAGIVYAATRKEVERIYTLLKNKNISVGKYHAGMSEKDRNDFQEQFLFENITVMVATSAFGMGIDKSNVRYVIHYQIPKNMEAYYQEAGRAGRDGLMSDCILLFSAQDIQIQRYLIDVSEMDAEHKNFEYGKLQKMVDYCHTESCYQSYIVNYFGDETPEDCGRCGNCTDDRKQVDVTQMAQMVLSCIKRMKERFGKTMVSRVLTGSNDKKVNQFGFHQLSTYGILKERSQKDINEFIDFLSAEGYLQPSDGAYPTLTITSKGLEVLLGKQKIYRKEHVVIKQDRMENQALFQQLRDLRKEMATKEGVPAYIIFSDETLKEMSKYVPKTLNELLKIKGVGQKKLETYGKDFLATILTYIEQHDLEETSSVAVPIKPNEKEKTTFKEDTNKKTHYVTYELLQEGLSIKEIAKKRNFVSKTIESHIIKCIEEGMPIDWSQLLPKNYEPLIQQAIDETDSEFLTPVKEKLPEEISYFMIRLYKLKSKSS